MASGEVTWLTAEWRKIFVIARVLFILRSLCKSQSNCANTLHVRYVDSKNTCVINTVLIFLKVIYRIFSNLMRTLFTVLEG
jgi:hypothetical protein